MRPTHEASLQAEGGKPIAIPGMLSLGRSNSNSIVLTAGKVSRRHALVHAPNNGEFWLVDLGSSNGTYVNDQRIHLPVKLRDRDRIVIGGHSFIFLQDENTHDFEHTKSEETIHEFRIQQAWLLVADIENSAC